VDRSDWQRIQEIFHAALERPEAERDAFLEAACAGSPELLARVRSLLERDGRTEPLLDQPLDEVASSVLDASRTPGRHRPLPRRAFPGRGWHGRGVPGGAG
jgi:eukaryotic-like serine/threonine-protein kinase